MFTLCLATYTRSGETYTDGIDRVSMYLCHRLGERFKVCILCDEKLVLPCRPYKMEQIVFPGTKYRKIRHLIQNDASDYILSVDNDIIPNESAVWELMNRIGKQCFDIGWGRIRARFHPSFVSRLVEVDKLLSHDLIRPMLWKMGVGISIPGQLFCIRRAFFQSNVPEIDTYLDDLALGISANMKRAQRYVSSDILGVEHPNIRFSGLWKQRMRWALGYSSILSHSLHNRYIRRLVLIHGAAYHLLWLPYLCALLLLFLLSWPAAICFSLVSCFIIVRHAPFRIVTAVMYQFIFPLFHIWWLWCLFSSIWRGAIFKGDNSSSSKQF